jgi:serine/threonine-protein kinase
MPETSFRRYRFDGYLLDTRSRELRDADGTQVMLTAKAFDVLGFLIEHRDRLVGKEELLAAVWPGRVVEENNLTQAISSLRRALGGDAGDHRYIVTVPGRGYRFAAEAGDGDASPQLRRAGDPAAVVAGTGNQSQDPPIGMGKTEVTIPASADAGPPGHRYWLVGAALALALATAGVLLWYRQAAPDPAAVVTPGVPITLAILPFRPLSGDTRDQELELGLADTLITRLSRSPGVSIPTLGAAQAPALKGLDARAAGRELGVAYIVEGSTQRVGGQVRVNARLLSVHDGKVVWSNTFDAGLDQVFTLQDAVGKGIAQSLSLRTPHVSSRGASPCDGADASAYRAYLRGHYRLQRPNASRLTQALADFREAIDRDPTCARAWAGIATANRGLVMTADREPREYFALAKAAAERALAIDPESAEGYVAKGYNQFWYDWDWPGAEASLRRAVALDPNLAEAHIALAHLLSNLGRSAEAGASARRARELDPFSPIVNSLAAAFEQKDPKATSRRLQRVQELDPESWVALRIRAGMALAKGDAAAAVRDLEQALIVSEGSSQILNMLPQAYIAAGDRPAAERVLAELERRRRDEYVPATSVAAARLALGDREGALQLLEQGYEERDIRMSFLGSDWTWRKLYGEPRFQALLERLRLGGPRQAVGG